MDSIHWKVSRSWAIPAVGCLFLLEVGVQEVMVTEKVLEMPAKPHALDRLRLAEKGEVAFFWSRYGAAREGFIFKVVCADGRKLLQWVQEAGLPEQKIFNSGAAMPSVTLTGKAAREVLGKMLTKRQGLPAGNSLERGAGDA